MGVKCSPYALSLISKMSGHEKAVGGGDRDADCISGTAVVAINPSQPVQDMLAASMALPSVEKLLALCGLDRADVMPVKSLVSSWRWQGVQKLTFALVDHNWFDDSLDWRAKMAAAAAPHHTVLSDEAQYLRTVPEGLAGSGTLNVMGESVPATFVSSRVDESFKLTALLPAMSWPALKLSGMAPVSAGGDEWASVGPTVKLGGVQVGGVAKVVLQGYADLIGIRQWFAAEVTDKGIDLRLVGRVHAGVEMSVRAVAPPSGALNLRSTWWKVDGRGWWLSLATAFPFPLFLSS